MEASGQTAVLEQERPAPPPPVGAVRKPGPGRLVRRVLLFASPVLLVSELVAAKPLFTISAMFLI